MQKKDTLYLLEVGSNEYYDVERPAFDEGAWYGNPWGMHREIEVKIVFNE